MPTSRPSPSKRLSSRARARSRTRSITMSAKVAKTRPPLLRDHRELPPSPRLRRTAAAVAETGPEHRGDGDAGRLSDVRNQIISCNRCARLRTYCQRIATEKKAAHRHDTYWGRPVPGFGDRKRARADHRAGTRGARRQSHRSRLHRRRPARLGGLSDARHARARLRQHPDRTACRRWARAHRCVHRCRRQVRAARQQADTDGDRRLSFAPGRRGRGAAAASRSSSASAASRSTPPGASSPIAASSMRPRPPFGHDVAYETAGGYTVIGSYHPSRQNTNTGKLTPPMMDAIFARATADVDGAG